MRLLRDQSPRPRSTTASPAYPRLMAAGLLAVLSSACGGEVAGVPLPARQDTPKAPAAGGAPAAEPGDGDYDPGGAGAASWEDVPGGTAGTVAGVADAATGGNPAPVEVGVGGGGGVLSLRGAPGDHRWANGRGGRRLPVGQRRRRGALSRRGASGRQRRSPRGAAGSGGRRRVLLRRGAALERSGWRERRDPRARRRRGCRRLDRARRGRRWSRGASGCRTGSRVGSVSRTARGAHPLRRPPV